ncbi:hypothetical protein Q5P01_023426 [Channa striata]|uniref:Tetraspanin n=1 Tax=Channa striata TaxID=64152 RepID=A0AA88IWA9_CHASR|nr:hypothetical protein Q5P01_023426 [Channa striata]
MCSVKCWFIFFVSLFLASGVALITIGSLQYSTYKLMGCFTGESLCKIAIVIIAVGIAIVLVSFMGFIGAFTNNASVVSGFICILIVIILLEVFTGVAFYVFLRKDFLLKLNNDITFKMQNAIHHHSPQDRDAMNRIQNKFSCCGANNFRDWYGHEALGKPQTVPDSCCAVKQKGCGRDRNNIYEKGCIKAIMGFLLKNLLWVGCVCFTLGIAEILGLFVGVCFCMNLKGKSYENLS